LLNFYKSFFKVFTLKIAVIYCDSNKMQRRRQFMGIISWIIIGALAGWIASMITGNNRKMGAGKNILAGIAGAFIGGFIMNLIGGTGITGFNLWSLLVATGGAVILLLIINAVSRTAKEQTN